MGAVVEARAGGNVQTVRKRVINDTTRYRGVISLFLVLPFSFPCVTLYFLRARF